MSEEIRVSQQAIQTATSLLKGDLDDLCAFRLRPISGVLPVSGSADHDGRLAALVERSVCSFRDLLTSDAQAVSTLGGTIVGTDERLASAIEAS